MNYHPPPSREEGQVDAIRQHIKAGNLTWRLQRQGVKKIDNDPRQCLIHTDVEIRTPHLRGQ